MSFFSRVFGLDDPSAGDRPVDPHKPLPDAAARLAHETGPMGDTR